MELSGDLARQKLPDLLQGLVAFRQDGVLEVFESRGLNAEIGLARGEVRWARHRHWRGEEALLACIFWSEGWYRFQTRQEAIPEDARLPEDWKLTPFLLHAMYLADELDKRQLLVPPPVTPLLLHKPFSGPDPFGCGLEQVLAALQGPVPVTLQRLEDTLPLAPVKVRLAVAYLVEERALPSPSSEAAMGSSHRHSRWWARVAARYGGRFRLLVLAEGTIAQQEALAKVVGYLTEKLKVKDPWVSHSANGPSFARLSVPAGGIFSLTLISTESMDAIDRLGLAIGHDMVAGVGEGTVKCLEKFGLLGVQTKAFGSVEELLDGLANLD